MKNLSLLQQVLFVLAAFVWAGSANAYDFKAENKDGVTIYYNVSGNNASVTFGDDKYTGVVRIPSKVTFNEETFNVTSIGKKAFDYCKALESVELPETVTIIDEWAFNQCTSLTAINVPANVSNIEKYAFYGCKKLTAVQFPQGLKTIGESSFFGCDNIPAISIPASVQSIGNAAFANSASLVKIMVDAENAVYDSRQNCNAIIETATNTLMIGCKTTIIPQGITSIGKNAFTYCKTLESLELPESITTIDEWAFNQCTNLTAINIPANVSNIEKYAFYGCKKLTAVQFPQGLKTIGESSFFGCDNIPAISIPASVQSIGNAAFANSASLVKIMVDAENAVYDSRQNCNAIIETATNTLMIGCKTTTIPQGITSIGKNAFTYCKTLESLELPESITTIDEWAFNQCTSLTAINIPTNVVAIGKYAFSGCSHLASIISYIEEPFDVPNNTFSQDTKNTAILNVPYGTKNKYEATDGWEFVNISERSDSSESIPYVAWCDDNATLYFFCTDKPMAIGSKYNERTISKLWSGDEVTKTGESTPQWNTIKDIAIHAVFDESFSEVRPNSTYQWFYGFSNLEEIIGLKYLNTSEVVNMRAMFSLCEKLEAIDLSCFNTENVTTMVNMFNSCRSIKTLDVCTFNTANVTDMMQMFRECESLETLDLSHFETKNVETMHAMFYMCSCLKSIDLSSFNTENVTDMGWLFYGCSSLKSLDLSHFNTDQVIVMRTVFGGCESLEDLNINNWNTSKVESLRSMFINCKALKSLDLSHFNTGSNTSLTYMFYNCTNLEGVNLSGFDTKNVVECDSVFALCSNLKEIQLRSSNFDFQKVKSLRLMFYGCRSLTELSLSHFNTEHIEDMTALFYECTQLRTIYVSDKWSIKSLKSSKSMFYNCYNIIGGNGTVYESNHIDAAYARIDSEGAPGYFTDSKHSGVNTLKNDKEEFNNSWFSLNGIRLESKPQKQGTYIRQGRKIIIK